jgi:hypothetical protein
LFHGGLGGFGEGQQPSHFHRSLERPRASTVRLRCRRSSVTLS